MDLLLLGLAVLLGSAVVALLLAPAERGSSVVGAAGGVLGCVAGLVPAVQALLGGAFPILRTSWDVPYGSLAIGLTWTALRSWIGA